MTTDESEPSRGGAAAAAGGGGAGGAVAVPFVMRQLLHKVHTSPAGYVTRVCLAGCGLRDAHVPPLVELLHSSAVDVVGLLEGVAGALPITDEERGRRRRRRSRSVMPGPAEPP